MVCVEDYLLVEIFFSLRNLLVEAKE